MKKSIIFIWNKENVEKAPKEVGVLMLRTTPINGDVIHIEISEDLKEDLGIIFDDNVFPETKFFDWYTTDNIDEAKEIKKILISKYHLEDNENHD